MGGSCQAEPGCEPEAEAKQARQGMAAEAAQGSDHGGETDGGTLGTVVSGT